MPAPPPHGGGCSDRQDGECENTFFPPQGGGKLLTAPIRQASSVPPAAGRRKTHALRRGAKGTLRTLPAKKREQYLFPPQVCLHLAPILQKARCGAFPAPPPQGGGKLLTAPIRQTSSVPPAAGRRKTHALRRRTKSKWACGFCPQKSGNNTCSRRKYVYISLQPSEITSGRSFPAESSVISRSNLSTASSRRRKTVLTPSPNSVLKTRIPCSFR